MWPRGWGWGRGGDYADLINTECTTIQTTSAWSHMNTKLCKGSRINLYTHRWNTHRNLVDMYSRSIACCISSTVPTPKTNILSTIQYFHWGRQNVKYYWKHVELLHWPLLCWFKKKKERSWYLTFQVLRCKTKHFQTENTFHFWIFFMFSLLYTTLKQTLLTEHIC